MLIRVLFNYSIVSPFSLLKNSGSLLNKLVIKNDPRRKLSSYNTIMDLTSIIKVIETLVPKHFAEKWDNTGLLVEPLQKPPMNTIFFTNDLTEDVLKEALAAKSNLIISYHPSMFTGLKALRQKNWKDRVVMTCIANNIAIYSPHTACDAIEGGVNDWLIKCLDLTDVTPIKHCDEVDCHIIECIIQGDISPVSLIDRSIEFKILLTCFHGDKKCFKILTKSPNTDVICQMLLANPAVLSVSSYPNKKSVYSQLNGMGRIGNMKKPMKLDDCIQLIKTHLKLKNIRLALGVDCTSCTQITTVAVCAGSGGSILKGIPADLYITGEMSHHDILDAVHQKSSVILCEHSNSERGYLVQLVEQLRPLLRGINLVISAVDKDPIVIV